MGRQKLFKSFWQAGFECSTHVLRSGARLDLVASTKHDSLAERDFARLTEVGIHTAREGLRWHLIDQGSGHYDFSSAMPILLAARRQGIQIVWDLLHFGWPDRLDIFSAEWVGAFARFAGAFGQLLRNETSGSAYVVPINEISFVSWAGGDVGYLNPFAEARGPELKRQLVKGFLHASDALRAEVSDLRLVSPEPVIHISGNPDVPADVIQARQYTSLMYEAWDMITGRIQPELGGAESYLDIIGVNYYDRNQWRNYGHIIKRGDPEYRPFGDIVTEVYERYRRPVFVSETGCEGLERPDWLAYIAQQVRNAMRAGVPVEGVCLYPILNHPGWDDDRHCFNALWDYPQANGERVIYRPLADELARQQTLDKQVYEDPNFRFRSTRFDLPFSPPLEFCIPASATFDEPIRT